MINPGRIALSSTGPLSGKSSLAAALHNLYGYHIADHSRTIAQDMVDDLRAGHDNYDHLTIQEVYANKEKWRPALQYHASEVMLLNTPGGAMFWTLYTLQQVTAAASAALCLVGRSSNITLDTDVPIVYDPFRGEAQAEVMRKLGFTIVQLHIPEEVRMERAGDRYQAIADSMNSTLVAERGICDPDIILHATVPPHILASALMGVLQAEHPANIGPIVIDVSQV